MDIDFYDISTMLLRLLKFQAQVLFISRLKLFLYHRRLAYLRVRIEGQIFNVPLKASDF